MRISRLNLLKYGLFDDVALDLPKNDADIHIIYGDNEAGKSTALDAMENLLFGFEHSTPYDYQFKSGDLRVGAVLEGGDVSFDFLRRKGRRDTIVADDGQAIPDGEKELANLLQGVDKAFFLRMFLLNHSRLQAGSADLLAVGEDAGETLLASGAGIRGITEILQGYDDKANSLWTKNRSAKRGFYKAMAQLRSATDDQNAAVVNANEFKKAKRAFEDARDAYSAHREQVASFKARAEKLSRIRRVHANVNALINAETALEALGTYVELPDDAAEQLDAAERDLQHISTKKAFQSETIERRRAEIEDLDVDEALLQRAADIEALEVMRIKVQDGKDDLPRRREDLKAKKATVGELANELGWKLDKKTTAKDLLPSTLDASNARSLVTEYAGLTTRDEGATTALTKARQLVIRCKKAVTDGADMIDPSALRAAYAAAQGDSAVVGRRESAEVSRDRAQKAIDALRAGMTPTVDDDAALRSMSVPTPEAIEQHRDHITRLKTKHEDLSDDLRREKSALDELKYDSEDTRAGGTVLSNTDIEALRNKRDAAWALFIQRHVDGEAVGDEQWQQLFGSDADGRAVYTSLTRTADKGADDRFTTAETSAKLTELGVQIKKSEKRIESLTAELDNIQSQRDQTDTEWHSMWSDSGLTPGKPDKMVTWAASRTSCLEKLDERDRAAVEAKSLVDKEQALRDVLITAISALDTDAGPLDGQSLTQAMAVAKQLDNNIAENNQAVADRDASLRAAEDEEVTAVASLEMVRASIDDWQSRWDAILGKLGLAKSIKSHEVEAHIGLIDNVRKTEEQIDDLQQNRIDKIERDVKVFGDRVHALIEAVAADLAGKAADDVVVRLNGRLTAARSNQAKHKEAGDDIERCQGLLDNLLDDEQESKGVIANLHRLASTTTIPKLREAIARSNTSRDLAAKIDERTEALEQDGDSRTVDELRLEVEGVDLDKALVEANQIRADLTDLEEKTIELQNTMQEQRGTFEKIGASSDAAAAASRRQYALAELESVAESFVRARASERLLRWGIDYFRKQKQGPLLDKASKLFTTITGGRYQKLIVEYPDDVPVIAGLDTNGEAKETAQMSEGTRDQLYLALRLAAVEDYVERAAPMPFVVDDILINFDETRTEYAMNALADLSRRCQVIFFTHSSRLVEIAERVLPSPPSITNLSNPSHVTNS